MQSAWSLTGEQSEKTLTDGTEKVSSWPGFVREVFSRLYSGDRLTSTPEIRREHRWASQLHSMLDDLPEWKRLAERCRGDSYACKAATIGLSSGVIESIPEHCHDAEYSRRMVELLQDDWDLALDRNPAAPPPPGLQDAQSALDGARTEADANASGLNASGIRQAMRGAIAGASEHLDELDKAASACGWGTEDSGEGGESAAATKAALAERLKDSRKLVEIMELAGRMRDIMRETQAQKVRHGASELTDIELGADLGRLLPSELVALRHPGMKLLLYRRLLERGCLQYRLEAKEKLGKGPLVVCIDDSGSMHGSREVWSKAVALALLELARRQNRTFAYCTFSRQITREFVEPIGRKTSPVDLLDHLASFSGGGTDFDIPLKWALDRIEEDDRLEEADVIFISDGECACRGERIVKERIAKAGAHVWGVALGPDAVRSTGPGTMSSFCDQLWPITDLANKDQELDAAKGVLGV